MLPNENSRRCILSGETGARSGLIRLALGPDGVVAPDVRARAPGRGAWIGVNRAALENAQARGKLKGALARAFKGVAAAAPDNLAARIETALAADTLNRLGLELRAGRVIAGRERIEAAARKGAVHLLLHAADAGCDGRAKLDQAWRVGSDQEGSALRGMTLPASRAMLGQALGRENVVHLAVIDAGAAQRIALAIARWNEFSGDLRPGGPCANEAQGSSAAQRPSGAGETRMKVESSRSGQ